MAEKPVSDPSLCHGRAQSSAEQAQRDATHAHVHVALLLKDKTGNRVSHEKGICSNGGIASRPRQSSAASCSIRNAASTALRRAVKRHEYNLVQRLGDDAPAFVREKIAAKAADKPTAPKRPEVLDRSVSNEAALRTVISVV